MRIIFGIILLVSFANPLTALCQTITPCADIIACFDLREDQIKLTDKISQQFVKELELKTKGRQLSVDIYDCSSKDFEFGLDSLGSRFFTIIEISKGRWTVNNSFNIPFVFNVYRNNFKLEAFVKLYRRGIKIPILNNRLNIIVKGSRVYQLLRDDPHDGGLVVSNSKRISYEEKAERELIRQISNKVLDAMKGYGG